MICKYTVMFAAAAFAGMAMAEIHWERDAMPQEEPTPILIPSTDGLCGVSNGHTCLDSGFGPCCSTSGFCEFSPTACNTDCDPTYGTCIPEFEEPPSLPTDTPTPGPETPDHDHNCLVHFNQPSFCAEVEGFSIPSCIRYSAACKTQAQNCISRVNAEIGGNAAVDYGAPDECTQLARVCRQLEDVCYGLKGLNYRWQ